VNRLILLASMALPATVAAQAAPSAACEAVFAQVEPAYERNDARSLQRLYDEARNCGDDFRRGVGIRTARTMIGDAQAMIANGNGAAGEALLRESLGYARRWQALAMLGDFSHERREYAAAARHYQEALEEIRDEESTPSAPPNEVIERIFRRAEQSRLLADDFVAVVSRSTGEPGGLAAPSIRGFVPVAVAVPVTFEFDSTELTAQGRQAASDLLRVLEAEGLRAITLIGHTDPTGPDDYNLDLSARRARALANYLAANGFDGTVRTEGRGESEPLQVDQASRYTEDELYRLYRRVEMRRR
jgi:OOP family OmpA-OmpF porin